MEVYQSSKTAAEMEFALGAIPSIGANGNWFIGNVDTGVMARGVTPHIGANNHWFVGEQDTGVSAEGLTPYVGANGNWFIGEVDTGVYASGVKVTGAEVGQTIVVKAVDENGVPTEWEATDAAGGMELIYSGTMEESVSALRITTDLNGNQFELEEADIFISIPYDDNRTAAFRMDISLLDYHWTSTSITDGQKWLVHIKAYPFVNIVEVTRYYYGVNQRYRDTTGDPILKETLMTGFEVTNLVAGTRVACYGRRA